MRGSWIRFDSRFSYVDLEALGPAKHPLRAIHAIVDETFVGLPFASLSRFLPFTHGALPVLVWGGLRGGISIALALSLPDGSTKTMILR